MKRPVKLPAQVERAILFSNTPPAVTKNQTVLKLHSLVRKPWWVYHYLRLYEKDGGVKDEPARRIRVELSRLTAFVAKERFAQPGRAFLEERYARFKKAS